MCCSSVEERRCVGDVDRMYAENGIQWASEPMSGRRYAENRIHWAGRMRVGKMYAENGIQCAGRVHVGEDICEKPNTMCQPTLPVRHQRVLGGEQVDLLQLLRNDCPPVGQQLEKWHLNNPDIHIGGKINQSRCCFSTCLLLIAKNGEIKLHFSTYFSVGALPLQLLPPDF